MPEDCRRMFRQGTCGLILNTGMYLSEDDITPEIRNFCEEHSYPLFTMPWEIHIYDITRSYYNRIFRDTQSSDAVTEAVLDLISGSGTEHALNILARSGFTPDRSYLAYCIHADGPEQEKQRFETAVKLELKVHFPGSHMCRFREDILIVLPCTGKPEHTVSEAGAPAELKDAVRELASRISRSFSLWDIRSGLGSVSGLSDFPRSFSQARSALAACAAAGEIFRAFDDLGFYKILFSVTDQRVLDNYWREKLGPVLAYDKAHKSCCLETLYQYLMCRTGLNCWRHFISDRFVSHTLNIYICHESHSLHFRIHHHGLIFLRWFLRFCLLHPISSPHYQQAFLSPEIYFSSLKYVRLAAL